MRFELELEHKVSHAIYAVLSLDVTTGALIQSSNFCILMCNTDFVKTLLLTFNDEDDYL